MWSFISLYLKIKIWIPTSQSGSRCLMWALSNQLPFALSTSLRHYQKESSKVSLSPHFYQIDIFLSLSHSYSDHICEGNNNTRTFHLTDENIKETYTYIHCMTSQRQYNGLTLSEIHDSWMFLFCSSSATKFRKLFSSCHIGSGS